jgi:hypothetical protein
MKPESELVICGTTEEVAEKLYRKLLCNQGTALAVP